ncbi:MAG: OmpH family outer membrane protein [Acidobacteria bacterium]|nr:OmpH family outer membrane protein [Acidobacteriota bacterium]
MKGFAVIGTLTLMAATPALALAQTPAPAPSTAKPAAPQAPAPAPEPPRPFPEGSKVAFVVLQRIANESAEGKTATGRIQALQQKKAAELNEKNKQLQTAQQRLEKEASLLSATAAGELQKQVARLQQEIQRFTEDAQGEVQELQQQLQQEFQVRLEPVLQEIGREKGLHFIFNGPDAGLVWADTALDISGDVIKKLDAKPAGTKPPAQ